MPARSSGARRLLASLGAAASLAGADPRAAAPQSPRQANPERPTFATHAYAVAPGYAELEQGLSARGVASLREATSWVVDLKVGVSHNVQAALSGPLYSRTPDGWGIGDLGGTLKLRTDFSPRMAAAAVTSVTAPTGSVSEGTGAGRALGALTAVLSVDLPHTFHVDANAGPQGIGAGAPQMFVSVAGARALGRAGVTLEVFNFGSGGAGSHNSGVLGAITLRLAEWAVADAGGVARIASGTPDEVFVGLTTNLGRIW